MSLSPHIELAANLRRFILQRRFPLSAEKLLQSAIEEELKKTGFVFSREHRLDANDIPDFFFPLDDGRGVAMEIKIKGAKRAIYGQCVRYCEHPETAALILVTNIAMGFPKEIEGKPCFVASLGQGWL